MPEVCCMALNSSFLKALGKEIKKKSSSVEISEYSRSEVAIKEENDSNSSEVEEDEDNKIVIKHEEEIALTYKGFLEDIESDKEYEEEKEENVQLVNLKELSSKRFVLKYIIH